MRAQSTLHAILVVGAVARENRISRTRSCSTVLAINPGVRHKKHSNWLLTRSPSIASTSGMCSCCSVIPSWKARFGTWVSRLTMLVRSRSKLRSIRRPVRLRAKGRFPASSGLTLRSSNRTLDGGGVTRDRTFPHRLVSGKVLRGTALLRASCQVQWVCWQHGPRSRTPLGNI